MSYLKKDDEALPSISRDNRYCVKTDAMFSPKYNLDVSMTMRNIEKTKIYFIP